PSVQHFDDVRVRLRDQLGYACELAGTVGQHDPDLHMTVGCGEPERDDAFHHLRVDVSTTQDGDRVALGLHLAGEDSGDAGRAGGCHDELGPLEQNQQSSRDVVIADRDDVIDHVFDDLEVEGPGPGDRDAVG